MDMIIEYQVTQLLTWNVSVTLGSPSVSPFVMFYYSTLLRVHGPETPSPYSSHQR